ncbi:hypothetical protein [Wenling frogfish filovirus]|uniref:Uncharacterized protein n=1 Tax=Wenling frogfish filovirus TaxID=2116487 RepID=A0A2P1GN46_9MONO|nr:hypothetical protein KM519_gp08 [Wenling frogfish filovirus]AVM87239.1 hypothetical protein [Wenling frogfish filovirus]
MESYRPSRQTVTKGTHGPRPLKGPSSLAASTRATNPRGFPVSFELGPVMRDLLVGPDTIESVITRDNELVMFRGRTHNIDTKKLAAFRTLTEGINEARTITPGSMTEGSRFVNVISRHFPMEPVPSCLNMRLALRLLACVFLATRNLVEEG